MKRARWLIEAVLFVLLSLPLAALPFKLLVKTGELLGILVFSVWSSRRRVAIENIKLSALGSQLSAENIARESFKNLGRSFSEILKIYYGMGKRIIDSVEIEGAENLNKAKSKGRGVLFITGHCGNWELTPLAVSVKLTDTSVVARPINNPYLNKLVERIRQRYGNTVIYKQGALKAIMKKLREGGCVGILMDQAVLSDEGFVIDFLGRGAWTTKMPALLARKTGAAVLPAFIHRTDKGHKVKIYPEIKLSAGENKENAILEDTMNFSGFIENYIREHPSEWLWIHKRWKRVAHPQV